VGGSKHNETKGSVDVIWNNTVSGLLTVNTSGNASGKTCAGQYDALSVSIRFIPTPAFSPNIVKIPCVAGSTTISCNQLSGSVSHYVWTLPIGFTAMSGTTANGVTVTTSNSLPVSYTQTATGNITVRGRMISCTKDDGSFPEGSAATLTIDRTPPTIGFTAAPTPLCPGSSGVYTTQAVPGGTYDWQLIGDTYGVSIVNGTTATTLNGGSNSISIHATTAGSQGFQVRVRVSTPCGTGPYTASSSIYVGKPTFVFSGATTVPQFANGQITASIPVGQMATSYEWTVVNAPGWRFLNGFTSPLLNFEASTSPGNFYFTTTNACGSTTRSITIRISTDGSCGGWHCPRIGHISSNPADDEFQASYEDPQHRKTETVRMELSDQFGRIVRVGKTVDNSLKFYTKDLTGGVYVLRMYFKDEVISKKVYINH